MSKKKICEQTVNTGFHFERVWWPPLAIHEFSRDVEGVDGLGHELVYEVHAALLLDHLLCLVVVVRVLDAHIVLVLLLALVLQLGVK